MNAEPEVMNDEDRWNPALADPDWRFEEPEPEPEPTRPSEEVRRARRRRRIRCKGALAAADVTCVLLAVVVAGATTSLRQEDASAGTTWLFLPGVLLVWSVALSRQGLYAARQVRRRLGELRRIVRGTTVAVSALALAGYVLDQSIAVRWFVVLGLAGGVLLTVEREIARQVFRRLRGGGSCRRPVVLVGTNDEAQELARAIDADPTIGYEVLGFVTDEPVHLVDAGIRHRVLGSIADVVAIADATSAAGVVIAATSVSTPVSNRLARTLTDVGIHVELTSTLRDVVAERLVVAEVGRFPTLYVEPVRRGGWRAVAKQCFDAVVAGLLLAVCSPLLAVVAGLVRSTSSGPVLFRQTRVGRDGQPFQVLKFRTMVADAEEQLAGLLASNEASGPLFKMADDPRVTPVGRVLRRSSLDELPQLWNVVRGDMSLVGPRPALPAETLDWAPELHDRLRVKPGITGMWQVNGRSSASFDDYVRHDLFYVDNWSLLADVAILARTLPAVVSRRGAH